MNDLARHYLNQLVAFPTISRDSNLDLIRYVQAEFAQYGIESHIFPNDDGQKAGLIAQTGPNTDGGVVLSAHSDVVPVDGQEWDTDPFEVVEKNGRLYGRGTCDMKGFVAMAMAAMVDAAQKPLKRPLQFALSRDEEIGLLGASDVAQGLLDTYAKASAVLVGEPTQMQVVTGHKSCDEIAIIVRGFEVHSSQLFNGVSAVMVAAQIIDWARKQNLHNRAQTPSDIAALYDPPFTTLHVGQVNGGTAQNITAKECRFSIDLRCVGGETYHQWVQKLRDFIAPIEREMQGIHPQTGIDIKITSSPALTPEAGGAAEELARQLTGDNGTHTVAYGTDGAHFQRLGFSTVICGPGSIAQAHQPNEYLEVSEFQAGITLLDRLIASLQT